MKDIQHILNSNGLPCPIDDPARSPGCNDQALGAVRLTKKVAHLKETPRMGRHCAADTTVGGRKSLTYLNCSCAMAGTVAAKHSRQQHGSKCCELKPRCMTLPRFWRLPMSCCPSLS